MYNTFINKHKIKLNNMYRITLTNLLRSVLQKSLVKKNNSLFRKKLQTVIIPRRSKLYIPNVICLALVNFISIAKAESININKVTNGDDFQNEELILKSISQSDELFSIGKFEESFKVLEPFQSSDNVEILWRLSRALYNMSKQKGISKSENASLIKKAFDHVDRALKLDNKNFAVHKWMAILIDAKSALDGVKARINSLPAFKDHLTIAAELNPKDATLIYMLGQYMYNIADMSRLQRVLAKTLFATPPEATFDEAFYYFSKAEEVEPNFYSANLLMLGKTLIKLKRIEAAHYWLKCAIAYPVRTDEDEAVRLEAEELLKKYPAVKQEVKNDKS